MVTRTKTSRVTKTAVQPEPVFNDDNLIMDTAPIYARPSQNKSGKSKLAMFGVPAALVLTAGIVIATSQPRSEAAVQAQDKPAASGLKMSSAEPPKPAPPTATERTAEATPPPAATTPAPARRSAAPAARRAPEQAAAAPDVTSAAQDASAIVAPTPAPVTAPAPAVTSAPSTPPAESPVTAPSAVPDQIAPSSAPTPAAPEGIAPTAPAEAAPVVQ